MAEKGSEVKALQDVGSGSAKKPRMALINSGDNPGIKRVKERWQDALEVLAEATGVNTVED